MTLLRSHSRGRARARLAGALVLLAALLSPLGLVSGTASASPVQKPTVVSALAPRHALRPLAPVARAGPRIPTSPGCNPSNDGGTYTDGNGVRWVCVCWPYIVTLGDCVWIRDRSQNLGIDYLVQIQDPSHAEDNYKARLVAQTDGNLVVYDENFKARWAAHTVGTGAYTVFQSDGNLVVYNRSGRAVWASNTCCYSGNYLSVQADGNVVIYTRFGYPLWATGTNH